MQKSRREFLLKTIRGIGYYAFGSVAWGVYLNQSQANTDILRPPGALNEEEFIKTCIRCGMCVEACPYDVLKLSKISDKISLGTPFYTPRESACRMCEDMPCVTNCPTNGLDIKILIKDDKLSIYNAHMGLAIINTKTCLAYLGLQCTMCFQACPLTQEAIYLKKERNERTDMNAFLLPVINPNICTGCGMCEHACPTTNPSIFVKPLSHFKGDIGSFYVIGWEDGDENRITDKSGITKLQKTQRNQKSVLDNVNDIDGILEGLYE